MKNITLFYLLLFSANCFAQEASNRQKKDDYGLYISGGCHVGFWAAVFNKQVSLKELPYNIHIDKTFSRKYAIGIGYSFDVFDGDPITDFNNERRTTRQNLRLRFCRFLNNHEQSFAPYIGASAGVSIWKPLNGNYYSNNYNYWPTAQFIFGMKVKLSEAVFWQTEFGVGPPYVCQTSLGIHF